MPGFSALSASPIYNDINHSRFYSPGEKVSRNEHFFFLHEMIRTKFEEKKAKRECEVEVDDTCEGFSTLLEHHL